MNNTPKEPPLTPHYHESLRAAFFRVCLGTVLLFMLISGALIMALSRLGRLSFFLHRPTFLLLCVYLLCIVVSLVLAFFVNSRILTPMEQLSEASRRVATGDFSTRIALDTTAEELNQTFSNFNDMVAALGSIDSLQSDFIASVSHEFKTPLAALEGYVTLLQDEGLSSEERQDCMDHILSATRRLGTLCANILLLSKLENQTEPPPMTAFRLDELIRSALVDTEQLWSEKQLQFDLEELTDTLITSSEGLLSHVFANLIGNAIKFSNIGGIIRIGIRRQAADVTIFVEDEGEGMDKETLSHIFSKFYQGDSSHKSEGNGLGLALCRQIVVLCGGSIQAESQKGHGSRFTVTLPDLPSI